MPTVGQINDKISELRSKISITEGLVLHMKANYMSSDSGDAEMHFTRSDGGPVPQAHIQSTIADYVEYMDTLRAELGQWENLTVSVPEPKTEITGGPKSATPTKKTAKESHGTARRSEDQPAPGHATGGKTQ